MWPSPVSQIEQFSNMTANLVASVLHKPPPPDSIHFFQFMGMQLLTTSSIAFAFSDRPTISALRPCWVSSLGALDYSTKID